MLSFVLVLSSGFLFPDVFPLPLAFVFSVLFILSTFRGKRLEKEAFYHLQLPAACLLVIAFIAIFNTGFDSVLIFRNLSPIVYLYAYTLLIVCRRRSTAAFDQSISRSLSFLAFTAAFLTFAALILGADFVQSLNSIYSPESSLANVEGSVRLASLSNGRLLTTFKQPLEAGTFSLLLFISILIVRKSECNRQWRLALLSSAFASLIPGLAALSKVAIIGPLLYLTLDFLFSLFLNHRSFKFYVKILLFAVPLLSVLLLIPVSSSTPFLEFFRIFLNLLTQNPFAGRYYESSGISTSSIYLTANSFSSLFWGRSLSDAFLALDSELVFVYFVSGLIGLTAYLGFIATSMRILFLSPIKGIVLRKDSVLIASFITIIMAGTGSFVFYNPRTCPISCLFIAIISCYSVSVKTPVANSISLRHGCTQNLSK